MPCIVHPRGFTDANLPWNDRIQNDPCGLPILTSLSGVDVSAESLCRFHYMMKFGANVPIVPLDTATKLLLHCDGADGSTVFADAVGHTVTANGNAQVDTAQFKFGTGSLLLDGTGDYLSTPDSPDWSVGSGDFTVDLQARFNALGTVQVLIGQWDTGSSQRSWFFYVNTGGALSFSYSLDGIANPGNGNPWTPVVNQWYHLAMVKSGTSLLLFADGEQRGNFTIPATAWFESTAPLTVGASLSAGVGTNFVNGWLDEVRFSKGARWTAPFTPPTAPYS